MGGATKAQDDVENIAFKKWVKAYKGPFSKKEAEVLFADLKKSPAMMAVKIRARSIIKNQYDIFVK